MSVFLLAGPAGVGAVGALGALGIALPMVAEEVVLGLYLGLLTGIVPALVSFALGFGFKYFTNVTVPGLGVVVLAGAMAGVSGGLLGVLSPEIAGNFTGVTAVVIILMASLWAHSVGDSLGATTPRALTIKRIRETRLSADLVERVDSFGQIRVQSAGDIHDIEGYPPLPDDVHEALRQRSWKFPATLPLPEIERRIEAQLLDEFALAEVSVQMDRRGRAELAAAPAPAGLSRRIPAGKRAVTIGTLLPTGVARGDVASIGGPETTVTGSVVSARSAAAVDDRPTTTATATRPAQTAEIQADAGTLPPKAPTTTGGTGQVTVAVGPDDAESLLAHDEAPIVVHSRGKQREYEAVALLTGHGNRFRKLTIREDSPLVGQRIAAGAVQAEYGIAVLTLHRGTAVEVAPGPDTAFAGGDQVIVAGGPENLRTFGRAAT